MNLEGCRKIKQALDQGLGAGSVEIVGGPVRAGESARYVSLKPTGYKDQWDAKVPSVALPHEILGALAARGFMANASGSTDATDVQLPLLTEIGVYTLPSKTQFDIQYPQVLVEDLHYE